MGKPFCLWVMAGPQFKVVKHPKGSMSFKEHKHVINCLLPSWQALKKKAGKEGGKEWPTTQDDQFFRHQSQTSAECATSMGSDPFNRAVLVCRVLAYSGLAALLWWRATADACIESLWADLREVINCARSMCGALTKLLSFLPSALGFSMIPWSPS